MADIDDNVQKKLALYLEEKARISDRDMGERYLENVKQNLRTIMNNLK